MSPVWKTQALRIDALSLRERATMFVSTALALAAAVDALVLAPALGERRQLTEQTQQRTHDLDDLRRQLAPSSTAADNSPQGRQRAAVDAARAQATALDAQIRQQLAGREEIARLPAVLDKLLRRHERLALTRLATVNEPAAPRADAPAVRWQGVDLSVAGSYHDLVEYLADLERALPGLRWGPLQLAAHSLPPELTVRLMLPGEQP
jgi:MSHA biogenesis protein MshJ